MQLINSARLGPGELESDSRKSSAVDWSAAEGFMRASCDVPR